MAKKRSPELLRQLLVSEAVVDLSRIKSALGGVSAITAFRYLRQGPLLSRPPVMERSDRLSAETHCRNGNVVHKVVLISMMRLCGNTSSMMSTG